MKLDAHPVRYLFCYPGSSSPGHVEKVSEAILAESPCIAFELKDIELAIQQAIAHNPAMELELTIPQIAAMADESPEYGKIRYFMNLADARMLCCHLIHALATSDDRIAKKLEEVVKPAIQEAAAADGLPDPYEEEI